MEIQILHWFESLHNPITDPIMYFITTLGNGGIFWIILAAAMLIILPKRYKKVGLSMAIALILSLIFCNGIMKIFMEYFRQYMIIHFLLVTPLHHLQLQQLYSCGRKKKELQHLFLLH